MDREELKKRTKQFAHRCVKLALALPKTPLGNYIREPHVKRGAKYLACGFTAGFGSEKDKLNPY